MTNLEKRQIKQTPFVSVYRKPVQSSRSGTIRELFTGTKQEGGTYQEAFKAFNKFNDGNKVEAYNIALYLQHLYLTGKKWNTVRAAYYAIRHYTDIEIPSKELALLKSSMFESDSSKVFASSPVALSRNELSKALKGSTVRDRVLLSVGWFGSLRVSELSTIKKTDLTKYDDYYLLTIPKSKNYKRGDLHQKKLTIQKEDHLCPVQNLDTWLQRFDDEEYIFQGRDHNPISRSMVHKIIKSVVGKNYSCHSLRSGSLTHAIENGATIEQQLNLTGHRDASSLRPYNQSSLITNNGANLLY